MGLVKVAKLDRINIETKISKITFSHSVLSRTSVSWNVENFDQIIKIPSNFEISRFKVFTIKPHGISRGAPDLVKNTGKTSIFGIFLIRRTGFCVSWVTKLIGNVLGGVCVHMVKIWKFQISNFKNNGYFWTQKVTENCTTTTNNTQILVFPSPWRGPMGPDGGYQIKKNRQ